MKIKIIDSFESYDYLFYEAVFDPTFEGGIEVGSFSLTRQTFFTKGKFIQRVLKDRISQEMCGMQILRNHRFFSTLSRKLDQLWTGGILNFYNIAWQKFGDPKRFEHLYVFEPQVLTMKHLEPGFVIFLVSLLVSLISFIIECVLERFVLNLK